MSSELAKVISLSNEIGGDLAEQASFNSVHLYKLMIYSDSVFNLNNLHTDIKHILIIKRLDCIHVQFKCLSNFNFKEISTKAIYLDCQSY